MGFTFLHAADVHLDSPLRGLVRRTGGSAHRFVDATRRALEALVAHAIERNVAFVLLAGDLYDGDWRDHATGHFAVAQFARLDRAGIPVVFVSGNHDAEGVLTKGLPLPGNMTSLSTKAVETIVLDRVGVAIHGRGFRTRHVEENVALTYPEAIPGLFNVALLHTSLTGRDGHGTYAPCSIDDLRRLGHDYWALGHVHKREVVCVSPHVVYPGNLQGRHSGETGPKGCCLVHVEDRAVTGVDFVACDVARFETLDLDVSGIDEMARVYERFAEVARPVVATADGRPVALRVRLMGAAPLRARFVTDRRALEEGLQAAAQAVDEDLLIEKLVDLSEGERADPRRMPIPHFDEILSESARDDGLLASLSETFSAIRSMLPRDAADVMERGDATAGEFVRLAVADAMRGLTGGERRS